MLILHNGRLLSPNRLYATAMVIDHGRIMRIGTDDEMIANAPVSAQRFDLNQRTVLPGFTDAHIHLSQYAANLTQIHCDSLSREEILDLVAEKSRTVPKGAAIRGHGWDHNLWEGCYGTLEELNSAAPDHPVYLTAKSLHAAWANTQALNEAGIDENKPDPPGGKILRDARDHPSGILLEGAMRLVEANFPPPTIPELVRMIRIAQNELLRVGITAIHEFDDWNCRLALEKMRSDDQLSLRVHKIILLDELEKAKSAGEYYGKGDEWITTGAVKVFADGALGPQTAAMFESYENSNGNCGILLKTEEELTAIGISAAQAGLPLTVHAIGDLANHTVIRAIAAIRDYEEANRLPHLRHRIEHVQTICPDDLMQLSPLKIIASVQPYHALSDMEMAIKYLGKRTVNAYSYGSMARSGATLVFGSDAPVEAPNPFLAIHAACTRKRSDGFPSTDGWHPEHKLSLEQAFKAHTQAPGFAAGWESWYGLLEPGYAADLLIFAVDPYQLQLEEIASLKPERVMVAGKWIDSEMGIDHV